MGYRGKRFLDVTISLFLLIILSPLFLLIALAIRIFSGPPVIYLREMVGYKGKHFIMFKFRSMIRGADGQEKDIFLETREKKSIKDSRVTKIGAILRKTSLDELPQFINVIKGEMTLVGATRPRFPWVVSRWSDSRRKNYTSFPPGLTGLVQVTDRSFRDFSSEVERLESEYLEKCSLWFDLRIVIKTIPVVMLGR